MRRPTAATLALVLLRRVSGAAYGDALCGDLLEEYARTGSRRRFWTEIAAGLLRGLWVRYGDGLQPVVFSAGWSLLYPVWRAAEGGRVWPALAEWSFGLDWPYSSAAMLASAGLSPLLFVWLGALLYVLRNQKGSAGVRWFAIARGLSVSLSVLLVSWVAVMTYAGGEANAGRLAEESAAAPGVHLNWLVLALTLSLLMATFPARPLRVRLR